MSLRRFYISPQMVLAPQPEITGSDAGHISRVLRLTTGDVVELFDGKGNGYRAQIISAAPKRVRFTIEKTFPLLSESSVHITLAQGVYGPFAGLAQLSPGDLMTVYQGDRKFNYVIDDYEIVDRTAIEVTYPSSNGQLTLITCNNWNSETGQYEQRLVVTSHLIEN